MVSVSVSVSLFPSIVLIVIGFFSLRNFEELQNESFWVNHTLEVMAELRQLNESVSRIESSARGYLLSGESSLKTEFTAEQARADASLRKLRTLTADNPDPDRRDSTVMETLFTGRIESIWRKNWSFAATVA